MTAKAGMAFVTEQLRNAVAEKKPDPESALEKALDKASQVFSGSYSSDSTDSRSLYVQRSFESFDELRSGLPKWAPALYADLVSASAMEGGAP